MTAFLDGSDASLDAHARALALAARTVEDELLDAPSPLPPLTPAALDRLLDLEGARERGAGLEATLELVGRRIVRNSVLAGHPRSTAHLHCPPLLASLAADAIVSAVNQSLDSWDQGPAATHVERRLVDWLGRVYGLGPMADGVFTSGGSQSNLMGLLLARDHAAAQRGLSVGRDGITDVARRFRIVCSSATHLSVRKAARVLGLGDRAIVEVPTDVRGALDPSDVDATLAALTAGSLIPIAIVATAGTTDLGVIDPLAALAAVARRWGVWLHVDAAIGGALVLSDREAPRLRGIEAADSVTVDFHKLWFQAITCGAFLVRDGATLEPARLHSDYLNPDEDDLPNLVDKSLQTTRRFDALKLLVSLRAHGRRLGGAVEATLDLAARAAGLVATDPSLQLGRPPSLNTVLFRYAGDEPYEPEELDRVNDAIRSSLLHSGTAVIGRTRLEGRVFLKLVLMNPATTADDLQELLALVVDVGSALHAPHPAVV